MNKFLYSNIEYVHDLHNAQSDTTRLGFFAEWFDGTDWRISLCAVEHLKPEEFEALDNISKTFLENPFSLLFESADHYFRRLHDPIQTSYFLPKFLVKMFPNNMVIQAKTLFESTITNNETPDEVFEELAVGLAEPHRIAHWYHIKS